MKTIVKKKAITILLATVMTAASIVPAAPVMAKKKYTKAKTTVTVQKKAKTFKKTISLTEKLTIKVKYKKKKIKAAKVTFKSSKKKVATVSKKGVVTPKKVGKTTISIKYGKKKAKLKLMVVKGVSSVKINKDLVDLKLGESRTLSAKVNPANATIKTVKWYSSNPSVVGVTNDGVITGLKDGLAVITAVSDQGNKKDTCNITVSSSYTTGSSYAEPIGGKNKSGNPGTGNSGSTTKPSSGSGSSTGNAGGQSSGGNSSQSGNGQGSSGTGSGTGNSGSGSAGSLTPEPDKKVTFVLGDDSTYDSLIAPNWQGDPNDPMATMTFRQRAFMYSPYGYDINTMSPGWHKILLPVLFTSSTAMGKEHGGGYVWTSNHSNAQTLETWTTHTTYDFTDGKTKAAIFKTYEGANYEDVSVGTLMSVDEFAKRMWTKYPQLKNIFYDSDVVRMIEQTVAKPQDSYEATLFLYDPSNYIAKVRKYSSATQFLNAEYKDTDFAEIATWYNEYSNETVYTKELAKSLFYEWAAEMDKWVRDGVHMKWQYFCYGDGDNNPMHYHYWMYTNPNDAVENEHRAGPGILRVGSWAGWHPVIMDEVECWIYVPTKK